MNGLRRRRKEERNNESPVQLGGKKPAVKKKKSVVLTLPKSRRLNRTKRKSLNDGCKGQRDIRSYLLGKGDGYDYG